MTTEKLKTEQVDDVQNPEDNVFDATTGVTPAEKEIRPRMASEETEARVSQSGEQRDRKNSSKSSKKGKGKGKEDCRIPSHSTLAPPLPEIRLRKLVDERETLVEQVKRLKAQLEQKQNGSEEGVSPEGDVLENGTDPVILDVQRDANRQISDLKFKLVKSEQEVTALEQNVVRLEGQVTRYKSASENAEKVEDELKAEKRKLQRELRSALDKIDELEANNSHLAKRLEKMKANRSALLSQQ
ncbi:hypothetical protein GJAV_G00205910 [Gymnothorax javanicus]|nr:hypothetical protein GJAV_G00205910 [Gymnothorax javanicus]